MTSALHLLLALAAAGGVLLGLPILATRLAGARHALAPVAELRRLWRKDAAGSGLGIAAFAPGAAFACDGAALLLVPTAPAGLPGPFGDLAAAFGLLAAGRVLTALAVFEGSGTGGGAAASRASLVLAASGAGAVLIVAVVGGAGGSSNILPRLGALRDLAGPILPVALAGVAACVLGWADRWFALLPDAFAGGPALALLRVSAAVRCAAWLDLAAALLPPAPPESAWESLLLWAAKVGALLVALSVADAWAGRVGGPRPVAAPALAALFGLLGAVLLALRGGPA